MLKNDGQGNSTQTGIVYEKQMDVPQLLQNQGLEVRGKDIYHNGQQIGTIYVQTEIDTFLKENGIKQRNLIPWTFKPDTAIITSNTAHIIEKKYQQVAGSADEKILTVEYKMREWQKIFSPLGLNVKYHFILSSWYQQQKYVNALSFIKEKGGDYTFDYFPADVIINTSIEKP